MTPWYREYFGAEFWRFAEREYTTERTAQQVSYLYRVLEESAPGRRIVDVGCGLGRHAIGLARAGFEVTGLDVSEWAIDEARRRGARAGVDVRWEVVDLLVEDAWPLTTVDAAICMQWFGWGSDADQRRLLRRIRHHLVANGVLVVECSPVFWLTNDSSWPDGSTGVRTYRFESSYDPTSGRTKGSMKVSVSGGPERSFRHDVRLYSMAELTSLVREAGFAVERWDADLTPRLSVSSSSNMVALIARPLPAPPRSLAVTSWHTPPGVRLDLRYAPDEAELLDPSPSQIWEELVLSVARNGADAIANYPVDDPYGGERGAETVGGYFGCSIAPHQLTFAAGVTSLLHALCGLADGGLIATPELVHPDLAAWAVARGIEVCLLPEPATWDRLLADIDATRPALLHLDRPTFTGQLIPLNELEAVARAASRVGAVLLIDESAAPYVGPVGSAARLVNRVDNLVVLRGFTKAYSWGGLRAGFALASHGVASRVRELVPPLQVGELAFHGALRLLAAGDVFGRLRARIHAAKPASVELLEALGLEVIEGHEDLPWLAVSDAAGVASRLLDRCGIRGLRPAFAPAFPKPSTELLRLTIPLSYERMALLRRLVSGVTESARGAAAISDYSASIPTSSRPDKE
jgi:histidinol-phosphate/aromatic aminotransferase/cobyric acid decarboxylase-like protein/precorrin-6B methylase 2